MRRLIMQCKYSIKKNDAIKILNFFLLHHFNYKYTLNNDVSHL